MKKSLLIFILFLPVKLFAPGSHVVTLVKQPGINPYESLMEAMAIVESSGNPLATNYENNGFSVGLLQIRQAKLEDFNKDTGNNYFLNDCFKPEVSKDVFYWHASRYGPTEFEQISRTWNGGSRGMKIQQTERYWKKINKHLNSEPWKRKLPNPNTRSPGYYSGL